MDIALKGNSKRPRCHQQGAVSILILMDIALKAIYANISSQTALRFNPYSDGYCSESYVLGVVSLLVSGFQSLF